MKGWMKEENTMITCCSDGTRPVFLKLSGLITNSCCQGNDISGKSLFVGENKA